MILAQKTLGLRGVVTALLLFSCLCFGGSASVSLYEMGLSIFALVCLLVVVWSNTSPNIVGPPKWFIVAFVSLVVLQLIPLPDVVWSGMPQGQFAEGLRPNAQIKGMWKSVSIAPDATLYSLITATPALVVLWLVAGLSGSERDAIAKFLVLIVFCQALVGIAQAAGALSFNIYDYHHPKVAIGLFASRNHFADIVLVGTSLIFAYRKIWAKKYGFVASELILNSLITVFLITMIGSASRSGLLLFLIILFTCYGLTIEKKHRIFFVTVLGLFAASLWLPLKMLPHSGIIKTTVARFNFIDDGRWAIWKNIVIDTEFYWPWGAGLGTFRQIFEKNEALKNVSPSYVNAAHNEYLQLLIELGSIGAIFGAFSVILILYGGFKDRPINLRHFCFIALTSIFMHSIVDYPFRIIGINVVIAFLFGFIISQDYVKIGKTSNEKARVFSDHVTL